MNVLKEKFKEQSTALKAEVKAMLKKDGSTVVGEVTLSQVFGGARGIKTMVYETSELDAQDGIRFRGYSIPELKELLPTGDGKEPLPEGLFWLMLVGEIPTEEEVRWLTGQWISRSHVPEHTFTVLDALPIDTHPMIQFNLAITSMATDSQFSKRYAEGMAKNEYWDATFEDAMNLIAR